MGKIRPEPPPRSAARARGGSSQELAAALPPPPRRPHPRSPGAGCNEPTAALPPPGCLGRGGAHPGLQSPPAPSPPPGFGSERSTPERRPRSRGRGTHDAGARTGAFGSGQIPGIQLKSWLTPLAGRRSRGICIMKIDSSKLPAWQPGRAPAGGGDPAAPAGAPAAGGAGGAGGRTPRAAGARSRGGGCGDLPGGEGGAAPASLAAFSERGVVKPSSSEKTLSLVIFLL